MAGVEDVARLALDDAWEHLGIRCAGLNAHSQLQGGTTANIRKFSPLAVTEAADGLEVVYAGWSTTVLADNKMVWTLGHQKLAGWFAEPLENREAAGTRKLDPLGDHNGLVCLLDAQGNLYLVRRCDQDNPENQTAWLQRIPTERPGHMTGVAMAGNGRIAVTFTVNLLCSVSEFNSLGQFLTWYQKPSGKGKASNFPLRGKPKQLLANAGTFLLLMETGEVYTWGDPRHQSLARPTMPANKPTIVDNLGGLKIIKVACGGWMGAALSGDGAFYLWGTGRPGTGRTIKCLREVEPGGVALVLLPGPNGEPLDVEDVAIGDGHIIATTDGGGLWVVGENGNGQLGIDSAEDFVEDWIEVSSTIRSVRPAICGPKSSYVFVRELRQHGPGAS